MKCLVCRLTGGPHIAAAAGGQAGDEGAAHVALLVLLRGDRNERLGARVSTGVHAGSGRAQQWKQWAPMLGRMPSGRPHAPTNP